MATRLNLEILPQPTETTCGPTCLHAVYRYFGENLPLPQVIGEITELSEGGTLAVLLGCHALARGYDATIYTLNLQVFDPTWFVSHNFPLKERLVAQMAAKDSPKLHTASKAYLEFLDRGGKIRMTDLTAGLLRKFLKKSIPVLTGLSSTYLYRSAREHGIKSESDDIRGYPTGHFVVLCGYDMADRSVMIADPFLPNPLGPEHHYEVDVDRVIRAILLGILTYDANLLIIQPGKKSRKVKHVDSDRR